MQADSIKLVVTYVTAAILALGSLVLAYLAWSQPTEPTRDLALIFGMLGTAFGASSGFLFSSESATRASRASEKAHEAGVYAGLATPASASFGEVAQPLGFDPREDVYEGEGDVAENEDPDLVDPDVPDEHRAPAQP